MSWEIKREKIDLFYNNHLGRLRALYPFVHIENPDDGKVPRIRISYSDILCIITYGDYPDSRKNSYSMSWYINEKPSKYYPEQTSESMFTIELDLVAAGGILFGQYLPNVNPPKVDPRGPAPPYNEAWGVEYNRNAINPAFQDMYNRMRENHRSRIEAQYAVERF